MGQRGRAAVDAIIKRYPEIYIRYTYPAQYGGQDPYVRGMMDRIRPTMVLFNSLRGDQVETFLVRVRREPDIRLLMVADVLKWR